MAGSTCRAAKDRSWQGIGGERCGKPATKRDYCGRPVCDSCFEWTEQARRDPNTVGSVLNQIIYSDPSKKN